MIIEYLIKYFYIIVSFIILVFAIILEQLRPLGSPSWAENQMQILCRRWRLRYDNGKDSQGVWAFFSLIMATWLPVVCVLVATWYLLVGIYFFIGLFLLYSTLAFRRHQRYFSGIRDALLEENVPRAKDILREWRNIIVPTEADVVEVSVRESFTVVQNQFFALLFWCMIPYIGVGMAFLYWLNQKIVEEWKPTPDGSNFHHYANLSLRYLSWFPQRCTGVLFALFGNFEMAIYNLREEWRSKNYNFLQAVGIGALGIIEPHTKTESETEYTLPQPTAVDWNIATVRSLGGLLARTALGYIALGFILFLIFRI